MRAQTHNLESFKKTAEDFALHLTPLPNRATVVGLYGDLGSGKTTFVQSAAKALGTSERISSPTFLILKTYKLKPISYKLLHHVDAYRLQSGEDLRKLGFEILLADPGNLIFVEWAERVSDLLPSDHLELHFAFVDESRRSINRG